MNQTYRAIVLDDEPPAHDLMEVFINRLPDLSCIATFSNAMQGLQAIQELKPDLLFLDIQMPEMTGLELMSLPLIHRPDIILTTAYPDYALKSYEFSVLDYLVKPIAFDRFMQAVVKFRQKYQAGISTGTGWQLAADPTLDKPVNEHGLINSADATSVWLREEKRLLQIPFQDILYVEGLKDYVKVHLKDQMILTHMSIGKAEKLFLPPQFVRIHRSYLVRQSAIRLIDGNTVVLTNGKELALGPHYRDELKKIIPALH